MSVMEYDYLHNKPEKEYFNMDVKRPRELTPITPEAVNYIESHREKYLSMKKNGYVSGLLDGVFLIINQHFCLEYPEVDKALFESIMKYLDDLYAYYDAYLAGQQTK